MEENKTEIEVLHKDGIFYAEVPINDGHIHFEFSEFEFGGRSQDCVIRCWIEIPGQTEDSLIQRINLLSGSARSDFVRQLASSFGKTAANWNLIFSQVCVSVNEALENSRKAKKFSDFDFKQATKLLGPFLEDQAVNTYFGMGGSGKTFLALEMGLSVALNIPFLGIDPSSTGNVMLVDYEDNHHSFFDRISLLCAERKVSNEELDERLFYFDPQGLPLHNLRFFLQKEVLSKNIKLLIVDSAALACAGEPESAAIANQLFNSLRALNVCVLLIAHKTKAEDSDKTPFGSIFFFNSSRNVWYVKKDQELGEDLSHVGLIHRKSNHSKLSVPFGVKIEFGNGSVKILKENNSRWGEDLSIKTRIMNSLEDSPKSIEELSKELTVPKDRLKPRLSELHNQGKINKPNHGGRWELLFPSEITL